MHMTMPIVACQYDFEIQFASEYRLKVLSWELDIIFQTT